MRVELWEQRDCKQERLIQQTAVFYSERERFTQYVFLDKMPIQATKSRNKVSMLNNRKKTICIRWKQLVSLGLVS